jgi:hypothetical protein
MPEARRFQESRMPGNPLVRFDEGRVGRTQVSPSLLLYRPNVLFQQNPVEPQISAGQQILRIGANLLGVSRRTLSRKLKLYYAETDKDFIHVS